MQTVADPGMRHGLKSAEQTIARQPKQVRTPAIRERRLQFADPSVWLKRAQRQVGDAPT